jgi:hypothetical protein
MAEGQQCCAYAQQLEVEKLTQLPGLEFLEGTLGPTEFRRVRRMQFLFKIGSKVAGSSELSGAVVLVQSVLSDSR